MPIPADRYIAFIQELQNAGTERQFQDLLSENDSLLRPELRQALLQLYENPDNDDNTREQIMALRDKVVPLICHRTFNYWLTITGQQEMEEKADELLYYLTHYSLTPYWEQFNNKKQTVAQKAVERLFLLQDTSQMAALCDHAAYFLGDPATLKLAPPGQKGLTEDGALSFAIWGDLFFNKRISMEAARTCYINALGIFKRSKYPEQWATLKFNLGMTYIHGKAEEYGENLEKAIQLFKASLRECTQKKMPSFRAEIMNQLGRAYTDRHKGQPALNIEKAIACFKSTLKEYTREKNAQKWAEINYNLGLAYGDRLKGKRAWNMEKVIVAFTASLEEFDYSQFPLKWAWSQHYLGEAYLNRRKGNRADNMEKSIAAFEKALLVRTQQQFPVEWGDSLKELGLAYQQRVQGERKENIEKSINCLEAALTAFDPEQTPFHWSQSQTYLGTAYRERANTTPEDLEKSVRHIEAGLQKSRHRKSSVHRAWVIHNLALAYMDRVKGDIIENREKAITYFEASLKGLSYKKYPGEWIKTRINLGRAYLFRAKTEIPDNAEKALAIIQPVLKKLDQKKYPENWAYAHNYLGLAYYFSKGDKVANQEKAIATIKMALDKYRQLNRPTECAWSWFYLGNAYTERIKGDIAENIEQAIGYYESALTVRTREKMSVEWTEIQEGLGNAYRKRVHGDPKENIEKSIRAYESALEVLKPELFPIRCLLVVMNLGSLLHEQQRWASAISILELGHQSIENMRHETAISLSKEQLSAEFSRLYRLLVHSCLQCHHYEKAFDYVCAAKGRSGVEKLGAQKPSIHKLSAIDPEMAKSWMDNESIWKQIEDLQQKIRQLPRQMNDGNGPSVAEYQKQVSRLHRLRRQKRDELFYRFPLFASTMALSAIRSRNARELAAHLQSTIIEYYCHEDGWIAFIATAENLYYVSLLDSAGSVITQTIEWVRSFENNGSFACGSIRQQRILKQLYQSLIEPLKKNLPAEGCLLIAMHEQMHHLPLGLAQKGNGTLFFEEYELSFIGSTNYAWTLYHQQMTEKNTTGRKNENVLLITHTGHAPYILKYAVSEAELIKTLFKTHQELREESATPRAVITVTEESAYTVLHFSCHGRFTPDQPDDSGLLLNGTLTVEKIVNELRLRNRPLVVLSACHTGKSRVDAADELYGLNHALLQAGASGIVSSLWAVNDQSTMQLFQNFYTQRNQESITDCVALRMAMKTVQQVTGYEKAYFWGAFQFFGLPQKK